MAEPGPEYPDENTLREWLNHGTGERYRWLHDKYERLVHHEDDLMNGRAEFFLVAQAALLTGLVTAYATASLPSFLFVAKAVTIAGFGCSVVGFLILSKTRSATQKLRDRLDAIERIQSSRVSLGTAMGLTQPFRLASGDGPDSNTSESKLRSLLSPSAVFVGSTVVAALVWGVAVLGALAR